MARITKADLERENRELKRQSGPDFLAINDLVENKVTWFKTKNHKIGISRLNSANGGIVIIVNGYAVSRYYEEWRSSLINGCPTSDVYMELSPVLAKIESLRD